MHSALFIDEILEAVLDECTKWEKEVYMKTAVQLARTCHSWKDPALDRVWGSLEDSKPLTDLLDRSDVVSTSMHFRLELF